MARHRRSRSTYQKLSAEVFRRTGLPLSRLLSSLIGLLVVGGLVAYALQANSGSTASDPETAASQYDSDGSDEQNFLSAGTLPQDFQKMELPVRIEKLDDMIQQCSHLVNRDSNYEEELKDKLVSLHALKCITLADNKISPTDAVKDFDAAVAQLLKSEAEREKYYYMIAYVYMTNLALIPDPQRYENTYSAVSLITESTPVLPSKAVGCFRSAIEYYRQSDDKVAASKLLRLMGEKMALAKEERIKDLGLSLIDYSTFSQYTDDDALRDTDGLALSTVDELLKQLSITPPRAENTYINLLQLPEHYLQTGAPKLAEKILTQLASAVQETDERFRNSLQLKIKRAETRVALLGKPFPLFNSDGDGKPFRRTKKDQTVVIFYSPRQQASLNALKNMRDSSPYDQWSTDFLAASTTDLTPKERTALEKQLPQFQFLDFPTSKNWFSNAGVSRVPYLMILDKEGIVERIGSP